MGLVLKEFLKKDSVLNPIWKLKENLQQSCKVKLMLRLTSVQKIDLVLKAEYKNSKHLL